jgi:hypothetical protein
MFNCFFTSTKSAETLFERHRSLVFFLFFMLDYEGE